MQHCWSWVHALQQRAWTSRSAAAPAPDALHTHCTAFSGLQHSAEMHVCQGYMSWHAHMRPCCRRQAGFGSEHSLALGHGAPFQAHEHRYTHACTHHAGPLATVVSVKSHTACSSAQARTRHAGAAWPALPQKSTSQRWWCSPKAAPADPPSPPQPRAGPACLHLGSPAQTGLPCAGACCYRCQASTRRC
eukprot:457261-Pelagomonas_calceolata.AAC.6